MGGEGDHRGRLLPSVARTRDLWRSRVWWCHRQDRVTVVATLALCVVFGLWAGSAVGRQLPGGPSAPLLAAGVVVGLLAGWVLLSTIVESSLEQHASRSFLAGFGSLEGDRLVVRRSAPQDAAAVVAMMDDEVMGANGLPASIRSQYLAALSLASVSQILNMVTILDRATGDVVGFSSFQRSQLDMDLPGTEGVESSLFLAPLHRGRGLAALAVDSLGRIAADRGVDTLWFGTRETNQPMRRSLEKAGAVLVTCRDHTLPNGETTPSTWYRLVTGRPAGSGPGGGPPPVP